MDSTLPRPPEIVDLHADVLIENSEDYDVDELIAISMDRLRETLDAAIYWGYPEIRYIHGKGRGRLREIVYEELRQYKADGAISGFYSSYQNEDIVVVRIGF
ncbi:MAG TPA: hypothetical protein PKA53_13560 [Sphingobacterium sp.]|nr:hypothetical protein [Sphingobacterium sp.]